MSTDNLTRDGLQPKFTEPAEALARLAAHHGPLIIDFDETLFLRNSTEEFIDTATPSVVAKLALSALEVVKPWRFFGGSATRDNWRLLLISVFFPWTWMLWRGRARRLGRSMMNDTLAKALLPHPGVVVVSIGYRRIIEPILRASALAHVDLVACRLLHFSDRGRGKLQLAERTLGEETVAGALAITDSIEDRAMLDATAAGLLVRWPTARYRRALASVYLPFEYVCRVKRPGQRYLWRGILQQDLAFWLLAAVPFAAAPLWTALGTTLLLVSFWCIYEMGYPDNDRIGMQHEVDPSLTEAFFAGEVATPWLPPVIWALSFGFLGLTALGGGIWPSLPEITTWATTLFAIWLIFRAYNRIDKPLRIYVYPLLQAFRAGAIVAVAEIAPLATSGLIGVVVSSWMGYVVYRQRGDNRWPDLPLGIIRLITTSLSATLLLIVLQPTAANLTVAAAAIALTTFTARNELLTLYRTARLVGSTS